jgi:cobalt/nickel transport protein
MRRPAVVAVLVFLIIAAAIACAWAAEQEKWPGVDEAVVKKFAKEAGREAREPFIEGDMLLFAFLIAGAAGGFMGGYFFRSVFPPREKGQKDV